MRSQSKPNSYGDHSFKSNDKMAQENRREKQQIRSQQMAKLFSSIKFNFGGKDKEGTRDITTGNNVRSGGGQRYTKPDTLYT